jgi:hypothetical protein
VIRYPAQDSEDIKISERGELTGQLRVDGLNRECEPQTAQSSQPENLDQVISVSSAKPCLEYSGIKDCKQQVHLPFRYLVCKKLCYIFCRYVKQKILSVKGGQAVEKL